MSLKRGADTAEGPESKRLRYDAPSSAWTYCGNTRSLTNLDLAVQQTDVFLKRLGVCAGVHSASDVQCRERNNGQSLLGTNQDWQGLTEHTWISFLDSCSQSNNIQPHGTRMPAEQAPTGLDAAANGDTLVAQHAERSGRPGYQQINSCLTLWLSRVAAILVLALGVHWSMCQHSHPRSIC